METGAPPLSAGTIFADRYEILGELGSGSSGQVYRARQLATGKTVAIKLLRSAESTASATGHEADRFRRESEIGATLSHTNIVELLDRGETAEGRLYAVFTYVPGETLEQALSREGQLPVRECLRLLAQVLDALACAHAQGIVHRDLKPANLMLSGSGARRNALVLDFGLGGVAEGRHRAAWQTLTQSGTFLGTPLYASPEQLMGQPATPRSDLYAWGLILLECLTGQHPFADRDALLSDEIEIPEWLRDHPLGALLEQVTARDASKRDVWAESLIERLEEIGRGKLPEPPAVSGAQRPPPLTERGERRHLTVMFCDLVDSTGLARRLGAERYRQVVQTVERRAAEAVERYGGQVVQYLGDGLLVYFGYPQAHEDDAARAVRAGREVLHQIRLLGPRLQVEHGIDLSLRVGIHSGPVVMSELGGAEKKEVLALGEAPNIAARLQALAEPGALLISEATRRLVAGLFATEDLGTPALKGIAEPLRVHRVGPASGVEGRLDRAPRLSPFVGRTQELGLLLDRFEEAREKRGQAVLIGGEAGIGKSRLVHQLREQLRESPHGWVECRCSPYTQSSPLYPMIELLEQALDLRSEETAEEKLSKLERGLAHARLELGESVPLFASLLSLRLPERYAPLEISPQLQRQKTLAALLSWLLALGENQPLVLLVEDLHWVDPSTQEWLGLLIEQCPTAGVLVLLTHRTEFEVPWAAREHMLPVALRRLKRRDAVDLIEGVVSRSNLSVAVVDRIADRSDGIPLFVEELAKGVVETSSKLEIPETLQDSLMARLDRLGEAKAVAQLGAVLGREFPYALLEAVAPLKASELEDGLARLVEAELLYQRGLPPAATYTFKHALVQDTAYDSLLEGQRKELHGRIVDAFHARFAERVTSEPEVIAWHCEKAGRASEAVLHYQRAGEGATRCSAHAEAVAYLERAIALLGTLPESSEHDQQELQLQLALGAPLQATRGMYAQEVERAYGRALELSRALADGTERFRTLAGLATFYRNREVVRAHELGEELLADAERTGEPSQLLFAHSTLGVVLHFRGELSRALAHDERAIALYDPADHALLESIYGLDPGVVSLCLASFARLQLGYAEHALQTVEQAIGRARGHAHAYSLAYSLNWAAIVLHLRGEAQRVLQSADEAIEISRQRGLAQQLSGALCFRAWALATIADAETAGRAVDGLPVSLSTDRPTHGPVEAPFASAVCDAQMRLRQLEAALDTADACLALWAELHAPYWDPEFLRMKGEIKLARDSAAHEEAERLFLRAIEISRHQAGRWLELRAATSLARLWQRQGRKEEARAFLTPVYDWFTEGFDTPVLQDAKALLAEL